MRCFLLLILVPLGKCGEAPEPPSAQAKPGFSVASEKSQKVAALRGSGSQGPPAGPPADSVEKPEMLPDVHFIADWLDMASKEMAKQLAYLPARKYLDVVTNESAFSVQAGGLASWAYDLEYFKARWADGWAGGWKVVAEYYNDTHSLLVNGHDVVALFARGDQCMIAFSGTHGLADWSTNLNTKTKATLAACNVYDAHEGFFEAFQQFVMNDAWVNVFEPYLEANCGGGIWTTGHSQGGAVAEIMAACLNGAGEELTIPDLVRWGRLVHPSRTVPTNVSVKGIYTYAAPGAAYTPLSNALSPYGIFEGRRFYNQDDWSFDVVPWLGFPFGLLHGKYAAVKLKTSPVTYQSWSGDCTTQPRMASLIPDIPQHLPPEYMRRLMAETRKVKLTILSAWGLKERHYSPFANPKPDAFVVIDAKNRVWGAMYRTHTSKASTEPKFDESFVLDKYEPEDEIQVTVWDERHPWAADERIGSVTLRSEMFDPYGYEGWMPLGKGAWLQVRVGFASVDL
ncbi:unnamed protein product [Effrenium voratum]|nr:unnamed protein product [Effrenium voratum]